MYTAFLFDIEKSEIYHVKLLYIIETHNLKVILKMNFKNHLILN